MIKHISAVIITKNAAETIKASLESLKDFEEIVVFDSGSSDETLNITKSFDNTLSYLKDFVNDDETKEHIKKIERKMRRKLVKYLN